LIRKRAAQTTAISISPAGVGGVSPGGVGDLIRGWRGISAAVAKSRVQLWRDIRADRFPAPVELGPNSVGWIRAEIDAWLASRPRRTYGHRADNFGP
jgi:predicted DNA-binding transcriptional regulator AlpA